MTGWIIAIVVAVVVLGAVLWVIGAYNALVRLRNRFKNAFTQIDVQLKRRHDLIPNLVETARGYISHERETLEAVIAARNQAAQMQKAASADPGDAPAMARLQGAEGTLTGTLGRLFAVMEAYPDLKANQNMMQLSEELTSTENKIAFARQAFNDAATSYNTQIESFPHNIIASIFSFEQAMLWEIELAEERQAPQVKF